MNETGGQTIHTVSQITDKIKAMLEEGFPFIWITGEISNFRSPQSGHYYFILKDDTAQISAVMFRGQNRNLRFEPADGMAVNGLGRISLYKQRGTYQVIFEYLEPKGVGALQVSFEQLKARLSDEGLFDPDRKKKIPYLPEKIALITSPTGAVIHDILKIARYRYENMNFLLIPVNVQGEGSIENIVAAIDRANKAGTDVAIIARGGGSLEDMHAFNSEAVARAISGSNCPIVSAVGHETDYTIADFVADLRAPTPSAAAEMVIPKKSDLLSKTKQINRKLHSVMAAKIVTAEKDLSYLMKHLVDPVRKIDDLKLKCDDMQQRMLTAIKRHLKSRKDRISWQSDILNQLSPRKNIDFHRTSLIHSKNDLERSIRRCMDIHQSRFKTHLEKLNALSPLAVLQRGYSITRTVGGHKIVRNQAQVAINQPLEVILGEGSIEVTVVDKKQEY